MPRHLVSMDADIVIDFPEGMILDPQQPEVQQLLREAFYDFLGAAKYIGLSFNINPEEEEPYEE